MKAMMPRRLAMKARPTPIAIPALAPVDRGSEGAAVLEEVGVVPCVIDAAVAGAVV
jgi:hypothetical protein